MKIAVSGKGGVGKSTVAAALALLLAKSGETVLALDADPDANLAHALGIPSEQQAGLIRVSEQLALIEERTGAKTGEYGSMFKLNPEVSDVAEKLASPWAGLHLLVLGAVRNGGSGCACPESSFIRALVTDLVLYKNETLIMDMEAGVEHLGRATSAGVDVMLVVAEPGQRSVDCAKSVVRMAEQIGLKKLIFIGNKVTGAEDEAFLRNALPDAQFAAMIPYSDKIKNADRDGVSVLDTADAELTACLDGLLSAVKKGLAPCGTSS